jgi:hypothetical protein
MLSVTNNPSMLRIVMLNVVFLSVITLSVVAPDNAPVTYKVDSRFFCTKKGFSE